MVDIDWAKYRALTALLKESTLELDEFHNLLRSELSQLIADVRREAKAEALFVAEGACAEQLRPENGQRGLAAYNQGVGECIRAIARERGAVPEAVLMAIDERFRAKGTKS